MELFSSSLNFNILVTVSTVFIIIEHG